MAEELKNASADLEGTSNDKDTPIIFLDNVKVTFKTRTGSILHPNKVQAVKGLTLKLMPGETIGIVGESGCGKSTTANVMCGLQKPTEGRVFFKGKDVTNRTAADRRTIGRVISVVFQDPATALNARMSIREQLMDPMIVHKVGDKASREARVHELIEMVGLPESVLDALPGQMSGGQRQRVAIARALASDPEVLLCDEATSALDPMTTQAILRLLQKINREMGITIVVITHEMAVIRQICTHVAILDGGVIAEEGSVDDVFTHTRSEAGKRLFGIVASENHEQVQEQPAIRIVFNGETIAEPIVADLILHLGVPLSIRSADVHTLNGAQYGQLLISRPDDPMVCHRAIEYLKERGLTVEEVRA